MIFLVEENRRRLLSPKPLNETERFLDTRRCSDFRELPAFLVGWQSFWKGPELLGRGLPNDKAGASGFKEEIRDATRGRQFTYILIRKHINI